MIPANAQLQYTPKHPRRELFYLCDAVASALEDAEPAETKHLAYLSVCLEVLAERPSCQELLDN